MGNTLVLDKRAEHLSRISWNWQILQGRSPGDRILMYSRGADHLHIKNWVSGVRFELSAGCLVSDRSASDVGANLLAFSLQTPI
jgi:hypothetical protein